MFLRVPVRTYKAQYNGFIGTLREARGRGLGRGPHAPGAPQLPVFARTLRVLKPVRHGSAGLSGRFQVRVQVCYPGLGGGQAGLWPSLSRTSARPSYKPDLTRTWPVLSPSRPPARELAPGPQQTPEAPGLALEKPPAPRRAGIPLT